ncbi:MAG: hypothetical protein ACRCX8_20980 [Sarcina sp.]
MKEHNNIINKIINDEKAETKVQYMDAINRLYDTYLGTLNNEDKGYMNNEDERACAPIELIYPSEIGIKLEDNNLLYFGTCKRSLFFKLTGTIKDEDKNFDEIASIERIELIKKQWIRKFKLASLYREYEHKEAEYKTLGNIKLAAICDGYVYDYALDNEMALLIKPIEHNFITKESVFGEKGQPMLEHLGEAISVALANRQQVKLLYVGKNKAAEFKEFNIGSNAGVITVNGEKKNIFIKDIYNEFAIISKMFEKGYVPPRDYGRPGVLSQEQVNKLKQYGAIQEKDAWKYLNGKEMYRPFRCTICKYKSKCDAISDDWNEVV